jgi:hypothetical protein
VQQLDEWATDVATRLFQLKSRSEPTLLPLTAPPLKAVSYVLNGC